ncbi:ABC transporter ATP-binding protein [Natranaerobius trueperi]|uniref:ABC-type quaternary amine transporter n=1 Tax=Natranaerobius trueperi TaxID=759412 RepID=A0A226BXW5_9FIRM|nr:ABC transporter ATP-binding protein [Natranaerobius trueperi]OWZ83174.1 spermidine/putrescine ABC transporter ATP-binding protein [Natranaerobius trueperi]
MALLRLEDISVGYNKKSLVLEKLNLSVNDGELISLLGPSGCGKTTTLRVIAGFLPTRSGNFIFKEQDYTKIPVYKRNFGYLFQNYALFPHMSVYENVAFGLKLRKVSPEEIKKRVAEVLEIVDLTGYESRYPGELSGGQSQRVALARALVINPDLLLLDEPLCNLDAKLRVTMRVEIRKIQQKLGITTVYVTHDQEECFSISDKVAILNKGDIEQLGTPEEIYSRPKTEFVADFVGFDNFVDVLDSTPREDGVHLSTEENYRFVATTYDGKEIKSPNRMAIRPDDIDIMKGGDNKEKANHIPGTVRIRTFLGQQYQYEVETPIGTIIVNDDTNELFDSEEKVTLKFKENKIVLL